MDNLIYLITIILGVIGFCVALNIFHKKRQQKPLICPLNMKCEQVIFSRYAKFMGIPLDILGMFYYGLIIISYVIFLFYPSLKNPLFVSTVSMMTTGGFLFSVYLISIQAFKLREWCSWCLMSATVSTSIFLLSLQTSMISKTLTLMAYDHKFVIVILYALTSAIGLGITAIMEILFIRFLKDSRISEEECSVLYIMREAAWLALGIMIVSNYFLYLTDPSLMTSSPRFLIKIIFLSLLVLVNLIYDLFISSKLVDIFSDKTNTLPSPSKSLKIMPFILGPISLSSWLMIFILEMAGNSPLSISQILYLYAAAIISTIIAER